MSLLVYKLSDYKHTAEREQFRTVCKALYSLYKDKGDICIFIGNYNIYDYELDGIIIKRDSIISVEFKNYGGKVIAVDNEQWKLSDGTIIKGGSHKSVYQQAKLNNVAIKREFVDKKIVKSSSLKDVATLVVFNQDITLDNKLSSKTQSWLHITDNTHFREKIEDITSKHIFLSNEEILGIIKKLGLNENYRYDEYCTWNKEHKKEHYNKENIGTKLGLRTQYSQANDVNYYIKTNINKILRELFPNIEYKLNIYNKDCVDLLFEEKGIHLQKDCVVTLFTQDLDYFQDTLNNIHEWNVSLNGSSLYWEFDKQNIQSLKRIYNNLCCKRLLVQNVQQTLPNWLDSFIYDTLKGVYCKSNEDIIVIDWDKNNILKYLGTYFPRSYTEAYCIISQYLKVANPFEEKDTISLFDFGCGTGGEIIGTITAIIEKNPNLQSINILALDGNNFALRIFERILKQYCTKSSVFITYKVIPLKIDDFYDLSILDNVFTQKFDIVLSFKAICEFVSKQCFKQNNAYTHLAKFFLPRITEDGILLLADVTTYNNILQDWLPHMMDEGLAKANCNVVAQNNGYNQAFFVTHSRKKDDISKIAWRLIRNNK